jgi:hypothetical protein
MFVLAQGQTNPTLAFEAGLYRGWGFPRSGSAGLGFQKGDLRSTSRATFSPLKVADPRSLINGLRPWPPPLRSFDHLALRDAQVVR